MRLFNWACNVTTFRCMVTMILFDAYAGLAFGVFLVVAFTKAVVNGASKFWWRMVIAAWKSKHLPGCAVCVGERIQAEESPADRGLGHEGGVVGEDTTPAYYHGWR